MAVAPRRIDALRRFEAEGMDVRQAWRGSREARRLRPGSRCAARVAEVLGEDRDRLSLGVLSALGGRRSPRPRAEGDGDRGGSGGRGGGYGAAGMGPQGVEQQQTHFLEVVVYHSCLRV